MVLKLEEGENWVDAAFGDRFKKSLSWTTNPWVTNIQRKDGQNKHQRSERPLIKVKYTSSYVHEVI